MALNGSENKHFRGRIVIGSYTNIESVGRRQAIGTARFGQKAKVGVARLNIFARTEALPKTQTLSPSFEKIVDARNLAAA